MEVVRQKIACTETDNIQDFHTACACQQGEQRLEI